MECQILLLYLCLFYPLSSCLPSFLSIMILFYCISLSHTKLTPLIHSLLFSVTTSHSLIRIVQKQSESNLPFFEVHKFSDHINLFLPNFFSFAPQFVHIAPPAGNYPSPVFASLVYFLSSILKYSCLSYLDVFLYKQSSLFQ